MSLRILKIGVHWSTAEAHAVLECLDQLRDCVWERFGDAIIESMREGSGLPGGGDSLQRPLPLEMQEEQSSF
jgi:hypothetical protein